MALASLAAWSSFKQLGHRDKSSTSLLIPRPGSMGGVFAKYSVQAVAWLFSKKSGLFFGISRFKKIDTVS